MKRVISILLLLSLCFPVYSQDENPTERMVEQKAEQIEIYFDSNSYVVDSLFRDNGASLELLERLHRDSLATISSVEVNSSASPESGRRHNEQLTKDRSNSIYEYLTKRFSLTDSLITKRHSGTNWDGLYSLVEASDMEYRDEVLDILANTPEQTWRRVNPDDEWLTMVDSRNRQLMDLDYGRPYRYMMENLFPQLRTGSIAIRYSQSIAPLIIEQQEEVETPVEITVDEEPEPKPEPEMEVIEVAQREKKPLKFALKTNLLYDAATILNIELEVLIGNRWSVAGEWISPWWVTKSNGYALQMLSGQIEGRYWFGNRTLRPQLTGWFAGLYAGGGLYDLQWDGNGYQGEFYIAAGVGGGYAHTINKKGNLRMEYSLGLGYLSTEYRYYEGRQDNEYLVWQHDGKYTWIGPTKAKVSLVWFIDWQRGGKR